MIFESFDRPIAGLRELRRDINSIYVGTAVVAFLFSCTGPVAIILSVGLGGGLTETEIGSWIFAGCVVSGLITIWFSLAYRQPLSFAWTIPGTVLLASAFDHLSFAEVIGAYWVTALLLAVIGLSGGVRKSLRYVPMPIVLAMVAGIFLEFGLDMVLSFQSEMLLSAIMVLAYFAVLVIPSLRAILPPVVMTLIAGIAVVLVTGNFSPSEGTLQWVALPVLHWPTFSQQSLFELVVPLAITVLVAQNGQGFAVLMSSGHKPPVNNMTIACGVGSACNAIFGAVSTCVTGPANAVLVSAGEPSRQYTAGVLFRIDDHCIWRSCICRDLAASEFASGVYRGVERTRFAAGLAEGVRYRIFRQISDERTGNTIGDSLRNFNLEYWRPFLGPGGRFGGSCLDRKRRLYATLGC